MVRKIILLVLFLGFLNSIGFADSRGCSSYYAYGKRIKFRLDYRLGDVFSIGRSDLVLGEAENRFGIGAELRLIDYFWLTFSYYPTEKKTIADNQFYGKNYQLGFKYYLIGSQRAMLSYLTGFDIWDVHCESEKQRSVRGFVGLELEIALFRNLKLAGSGKIYFLRNFEKFNKDRYLNFDSGSWIKIPGNSVNISAILSF